MTHYIEMSIKGIRQLKQAEILIIRLFNNPKARWCWKELDKLLFFVRDVGSRTREYQEDLEGHV